MNKQSKNQAKYDKAHIEQISLKLNKEYDKDILDKIHNTMQKDNVSKQGAIKKLIRNNEAIAEKNGYTLKRQNDKYYVYLDKHLISSLNATTDEKAIQIFNDFAKEKGKTIKLKDIKIK